MKQIKLVINELPETYNKIKDWHHMEKDAYNQLWYDLVSYAYREVLKEALINGKVSPKTPFKKAKIGFYLYFRDHTVRDKINFASGLKPALDALTNKVCGIIVDDKWVDIDDQYYIRFDKKRPRTEITIEEITDAEKESYTS